MSARTYDVAIVGAGIVGAACARECIRAGLHTAVFDREMIGGGATAAGMGHIVTMDDSEAQFALTRYSQRLWQELRTELPPEVEYEQRGTIWVAADEQEMTEVRRKHEYYETRAVPSRILGAEELETAEPNLRKGLSGGLLVSDDAVLYPPCAARFLMEGAEKEGVKLYLGAAVKTSAKGELQLSDGSRFSAGIVVNAAGTWASELMPGIDIKKRKGHLIITDRYHGCVRHQLVELGYLKSAHALTADSVAFNVQPRKTGQILIGSSRQFGAEDTEIDHAVLQRMVQRACEYMPALRQASAVRTWTGFRAATGDKLPLIGPWSEDPSIFLATGHEGLGITTSLGTARLLVDQITGRPSAIPREPYLPSRSRAVQHSHA